MRIHLAYRLMAAMTVALGMVLFVADGASAVGPGKKCGGLLPVLCDDGLFCQQPARRCAADGQGTCVRVPTKCNKNRRPVCGCDNQNYLNDCMRQMAKVSLKYKGMCK